MTHIAEITKGSEKQIAWATDIKRAAFAEHDKALTFDYTNSGDIVGAKNATMVRGFRDAAKSQYAGAFLAADAELAANDDAKFWIDNRDASIQMLAKQIVRAAQTEA